MAKKRSAATADIQPLPEKRAKAALILLPENNGSARSRFLPGVSQLRLARIQQMQADAAYLQMELDREWESVREDLLRGAMVEDGPLRAWIKCTLELNRYTGRLTESRKRHLRKRLMVR